MAKSKKTPKLDYGEVDDVLHAFHEEVMKHGPKAELEFLAGNIDQSRLDWHRGHHKYLKSIMHKLVPILRDHQK